MSTIDQTTKTITFPVWRDENRHWFFLKDILSYVAMWAVRQSPYDQPENLAEALAGLKFALLKLLPGFADNPLMQLSGKEIEDALLAAFADVPQIQAWNRPRSGHSAPFVLSSRYDQPHPDDDFIDLHALARNVKHSLLLERLYQTDYE